MNRDRRLGAIFAVGFSLICWFGVLHFFVACGATQRESTLIERLEAADRGRDLLDAVTTMATARLVIEEGDDVPQDDRVLTVHPPCGSGVRPYLWVSGRPRLGSVLKLIADPYGAPRSVDSGDLYDWPFVYLLAEFQAPRREPIPLPSGCALWIDPDSPSALVWSLGGRGGYQDPLVSVDPDGRLIRVRHEIPRLEAIVGRRVWIQLLAVDGNEWKTSQTTLLVFGRPF